MNIGSKIKEARINKSYSQQKLGDLVGVTKVSVCGYENGTRNPNMETFLKLIDVLEVTPNYLLGFDIDVVCEDEVPYVKKVSKTDLELINKLKKYPKLYKKLNENIDDLIKKITK